MKEKILTGLLFWYIGGFAFFLGSTTNTLPIIPLASFFISHYLGMYVYNYLILTKKRSVKIKNVYVYVVTDLLFNILIFTIITSINNYFYMNEISTLTVEPISYGILYSVFYCLFLRKIIKL